MPRPVSTAACAGALALALTLSLAACETRTPQRQGETQDFPVERDQRTDPGEVYEERTRGIFGASGFQFGRPAAPEEESGIGVSVYLWRASLDSLKALPLRSADPFGGLIQTEWYEPADTPGQRLRVDLRIQSPVLTADGVSASVFRQNIDDDGAWRDAPVDSATAVQLEETILKRARELRFVEAGG